MHSGPTKKHSRSEAIHAVPVGRRFCWDLLLMQQYIPPPRPAAPPMQPRQRKSNTALAAAAQSPVHSFEQGWSQSWQSVFTSQPNGSSHMPSRENAQELSYQVSSNPPLHVVAAVVSYAVVHVYDAWYPNSWTLISESKCIHRYSPSDTIGVTSSGWPCSFFSLQSWSGEVALPSYIESVSKDSV